MHIGICTLSVIPLRATNSHRAEMVNQVLFAEPFEICQQEKEWAYIRMLDTGYEGWVQQGQFIALPDDDDLNISASDFLVVDIGGAKAFAADKKVDLVPGTKIAKKLLEPQAAFPYRIEGSLRNPTRLDFEIMFPKLINYYHNNAYLWGGRTGCGIDCSGLSQSIYTYFGIQLPRDAYQQVEKGEVVNSLAEIKPGDLAFFDNEEGKVTHVGIMTDTETIFHASASVRIDRMDAQGIFHHEQNGYTHKLCAVKRFFN